MAATAYPVSGALDREVEYNRIDPFSRTWELCLAGVVLFSLGFGYLRKPMFWLGIASVAAGLGFTVYGLATRVSITRLAPVTNMFETVVYVSLVVAILGLWFNLLPLFGRGLQHAWRLTAVPVPWEAGPLNEERLALFRAETWRAVNWAMVLPRAALGVLAFLYMADCPSLPYASGYIALDPGGAATFSNLMAWGVGLCLLGLAVYYLPRAVLALVLSPVMVPYTLAKCGVAKPLEQVVARRAFAASGASVAFLAAFLACFIPTVDRNIFDKNINPVQPVLRDNFWLTSHVLTITASYGAGGWPGDWATSPWPSTCSGVIARKIQHRLRRSWWTGGNTARHCPAGRGFRRAAPASAGSLRDLGHVHLQGHPGGRGAPGGRNDPGGPLGGQVVGPILGLGPERSLGLGFLPGVSGDPPRPLCGLVRQLRPDHRLGDRGHGHSLGLVWSELCLRQRPAQLRRRHGRQTVGALLRGPQLVVCPGRGRPLQVPDAS